MNKDLRKERVEIFEETRNLYCTNKRLVDSINFSKQNQKVIAEEKSCGSRSILRSECLRT